MDLHHFIKPMPISFGQIGGDRAHLHPIAHGMGALKILAEDLNNLGQVIDVREAPSAYYVQDWEMSRNADLSAGYRHYSSGFSRRRRAWQRPEGRSRQ
jgi:hypothetical protein